MKLGGNEWMNFCQVSKPWTGFGPIILVPKCDRILQTLEDIWVSANAYSSTDLWFVCGYKTHVFHMMFRRLALSLTVWVRDP
jgi:hypothetical protein